MGGAFEGFGGLRNLCVCVVFWGGGGGRGGDVALSQWIFDVSKTRIEDG